MEVHCAVPTRPAFIIVPLLATLAVVSFASLSEDFYKLSCPNLNKIVGSAVKSNVLKDPRMGAFTLRMHFHDCFVKGCDASILLDDASSFVGEKTAGPNNNSLRGYGFIDRVKSEVEKSCPNVVSCADILALVARDSVVALGGKSWIVQLGRRDSTTAYFSIANSGVIPPPASNVSNLVRRFLDQGLSLQDMVVLSGSHTIGKSRCTSFKSRIYNDTNIDRKFALKRQKRCLIQTGLSDNDVFPLDHKTPRLFDNSYYKNIIVRTGLLHSDQVLHDGGDHDTTSLVDLYSKNLQQFFDDFGEAMIRMGNINPLLGNDGEIRKLCNRVNVN